MKMADRPVDLSDAQARVQELATNDDVDLVQIGGWKRSSRRFFFAVDTERSGQLSVIRWNALVTSDGSAVYAMDPTKKNALHRIVVAAKTGDQVDHWNGNTLDNRRANLRIVTAGQNGMNKVKKRSSGSRFKGVMWEKDRKLWSARIMVDGVYKNLGRYQSDVAAAWAYDQAAREYYREFALLNGVENPGDDGTTRVPHRDEVTRHAGAICAVRDGIDQAAKEFGVHRQTIFLWIKEFDPPGMFRSDTAVLGKCDLCRDRRRLLNQQHGHLVCRKCWQGDNRTGVRG